MVFLFYFFSISFLFLSLALIFPCISLFHHKKNSDPEEFHKKVFQPACQTREREEGEKMRDRRLVIGQQLKDISSSISPLSYSSAPYSQPPSGRTNSPSPSASAPGLPAYTGSSAAPTLQRRCLTVGLFYCFVFFVLSFCCYCCYCYDYCCYVYYC